MCVLAMYHGHDTIRYIPLKENNISKQPDWKSNEKLSEHDTVVLLHCT